MLRRSPCAASASRSPRLPHWPRAGSALGEHPCERRAHRAALGTRIQLSRMARWRTSASITGDRPRVDRDRRERSAGKLTVSAGAVAPRDAQIRGGRRAVDRLRLAAPRSPISGQLDSAWPMRRAWDLVRRCAGRPSAAARRDRDDRHVRRARAACPSDLAAPPPVPGVELDTIARQWLRVIAEPPAADVTTLAVPRRSYVPDGTQRTGSVPASRRGSSSPACRRSSRGAVRVRRGRPVLRSPRLRRHPDRAQPRDRSPRSPHSRARLHDQPAADQELLPHAPAQLRSQGGRRRCSPGASRHASRQDDDPRAGISTSSSSAPDLRPPRRGHLLVRHRSPRASSISSRPRFLAALTSEPTAMTRRVRRAGGLDLRQRPHASTSSFARCAATA